LKSSLITGLMRSALPSERSAIFPPEKNTCWLDIKYNTEYQSISNSKLKI
jgi:hypothetical protein